VQGSKCAPSLSRCLRCSDPPRLGTWIPRQKKVHTWIATLIRCQMNATDCTSIELLRGGPSSSEAVRFCLVLHTLVLGEQTSAILCSHFAWWEGGCAAGSLPPSHRPTSPGTCSDFVCLMALARVPSCWADAPRWGGGGCAAGSLPPFHHPK
jgi:hypothetical protein